MSNQTTIERLDGSLLKKLDPHGRMNLNSCLQCGRCSSGCTMRHETDILPHQLVRMAALGLENRLLESKAIWACISCQTCVSRCPMGVDTPALVDKLRTMTQQAPDQDLDRIRVFNDGLLSSVRVFGRTYEFAMMAVYKLRTRDLFSDMEKLPAMLLKGKMAILPPMTRGRKAVAEIFDRVRQARRGQS